MTNPLSAVGERNLCAHLGLWQSQHPALCSVVRLHRATWVQTELFLTFPPPAIGSISLIPLNAEDTAGRFRVWLSIPGRAQPILAWDRKVEGGFPELKVLVRAKIYIRRP